MRNGYDPSCPRRRRWNPNIDDFMRKVFARYPAALEHDPCPCGLTFAVLEQGNVRPGLHYVIDGDELRAEALALIAARHLPMMAAATGLLVIAEVA